MLDFWNLFEQVRVAWDWMRYLLHRHAGRGKQILRMNCDETNVQRAQRASRGLVVAPLRRAGPVVIPEGPDGRGSVSHLVFVCDDPVIQPFLPQVVVGNERMLRLCDLRILEPEIPPNVYVVRQKSSWINDALFQQTLRRMMLTGQQQTGQALHVTVVMSCSSFGILKTGVVCPTPHSVTNRLFPTIHFRAGSLAWTECHAAQAPSGRRARCISPR